MMIVNTAQTGTECNICEDIIVYGEKYIVTDGKAICMECAKQILKIMDRRK